MRARLQTFAFITVLLLSACGGADQTPSSSQEIEPAKTGPWKLDADNSGMTYITIKNNAVAEINTFRALDGRVTADGAASFTVVLDSVDTNNEIRDPRMRQFLFETDKHPFAKVTAQVDMTKFDDLAIGAGHTELLNATIDLHGVSDARQIYVTVTRLGTNAVLVANKAPVILDAADFGFADGLAKLQELAGLESISPAVPVTFSLVFERE